MSLGNDIKFKFQYPSIINNNKALLGCHHALWAMGAFVLQGEESRALTAKNYLQCVSLQRKFAKSCSISWR